VQTVQLIISETKKWESRGSVPGLVTGKPGSSTASSKPDGEGKFLAVNWNTEGQGFLHWGQRAWVKFDIAAASSTLTAPLVLLHGQTVPSHLSLLASGKEGESRMGLAPGHVYSYCT
jgi:hypothetical protein